MCKTSFFNLHELLPAFIRANNIGSLVNSLFEVNIFNPFHVIFFKNLILLFQQQFLPSSNFTFSSSSNGGIYVKSSSSPCKYKSTGRFLGIF